MPDTAPIRLTSAEIAAEHVAYHRAVGMSPRESAGAIGWTVPHDAQWGMVAALYAREAGNLVDRAGGGWCHKTSKAGALEALRPTARGVFPRVSLAGSAAFDVLSQCVKDRPCMPIRQPLAADSYGYGDAGGVNRSEWRSGF
jgi:hypothetical protein